MDRQKQDVQVDQQDIQVDQGDAYEFYRQWDRQGEKEDGFSQFAKDRLKAECGFDEAQAKLIVDEILVPFVNEADQLQREVMDDSKPKLVLRDKVKKALNSRLNDMDEDGKTLFNWLKRKWFQEPEPSYLKRLCGFLDKDKAEEAVRLFGAEASTDTTDRNDEEDIALSSLSSVDMAASEAILSCGEVAKDILAEQNGEAPTEAEREKAVAVIPDCLKTALNSDLLSDEERVLKKLLALHCLIKVVGSDKEQGTWNAAPLVAIEACRVAYREVVDAKSALKERQRMELEAILRHMAKIQ